MNTLAITLASIGMIVSLIGIIYSIRGNLTFWLYLNGACLLFNFYLLMDNLHGL